MARGHELVVLSNLCCTSDYKSTSDDQILKMNTIQKIALRGTVERGRYVLRLCQVHRLKKIDECYLINILIFFTFCFEGY